MLPLLLYFTVYIYVFHFHRRKSYKFKFTIPLRSQFDEIPDQWRLESHDLHWETLSGVQVLSEVNLINYTGDIFTLACDLDPVPPDKRVSLQSLLSCSWRKDCEKRDCVVLSSVLFLATSVPSSLSWLDEN